MTRLFNTFCAALALTAAATAQDEDFDLAGGSADPDFEGNAGAIIINGLELIVRQDLDFGVIAPNIDLPGTVSVLRGRNNSSVCDPSLTCLRNGTRARFTISGDPGRLVDISNPNEITIFNDSGFSMLIDDFVGAGSGNDTQYRGFQRLRNTGISRFNVGATLHVNPNQPPGLYTGLFTITVQYQ